ncbi:MAG: hypothetical protein JNG86_17935, partial [Verrucomicrobiaceae bacterium]|nr:hypothetical protein [Verrucomicrobiaceae bacterium]
MSQILHWIYTACRMGQSGTAGHQTYRMSNGITEQEDEELARLTYLGAASPDRPPARSFGITTLSSGRHVLFRCTQDAKDDLGRPSCFREAFLFSDLAHLTAPPWAFADSPQFREALDANEVSSPDLPPPLPPLTVLQPSPAYATHEARQTWLASMIQKSSGLPGRLAKALSLLERSLDDDSVRPVLLAASEEEALAAFALLWDV